MSSDYFSIGTEFDSSWGNSTQSQTVLPIPENVREMPCDTCSKESSRKLWTTVGKMGFISKVKDYRTCH